MSVVHAHAHGTQPIPTCKRLLFFFLPRLKWRARHKQKAKNVRGLQPAMLRMLMSLLLLRRVLLVLLTRSVPQVLLVAMVVRQHFHSPWHRF